MPVNFNEKTYLHTSPFSKTRVWKQRTYSVLLREKAIFLPKVFGFNQASLSLRQWSFLFQFDPAAITQLPTIQFVPKLPHLPLKGLET